MLRTAVIVEDCIATLQMTKFFLTKLGIQNIHTATNHQEFHTLINSNVLPDLVVTDWRIDAKLQGDQVISEMSKFNVPIAVVSSEQEKKLNFQQFQWFQKPLNTRAFTLWLENLQNVKFSK